MLDVGYNIKEWHESCEEKKLDSCMLGTTSEKNDCINMNTDAQEKCNLSYSTDPSTILQLVLNSVEEADQFYIDYATAMGFNVRKSHKENRKGGNIVKNRELVCSRAGLWMPLKEACIHFAHDISSGLYRVTNFNPYHNHPLETAKTEHVLKVNWLTFSGIRAGKAIDFMEHLESGPGKLPFRRKDDLIFSYTVDNEKTLTKLFWTNGMSRAEFRLFDNVLVFDNTYKTNTYQFPLVLFYGINNHLGTYLLQEFCAAIGGLSSKSIPTDQDVAMRIAIELEFPEAKHRICNWHLEHFGALLKRNYSIEKFEVTWVSLIEKHGVANHPWVIDIYRKRELWSEAYCRGHFMGMMGTAQRVEYLNALFKFSVGKIRAKFFENQEDAERSIPMIKNTALRILERQATFFYTNKVFSFVLEEIVKEQGLLLE
ncbi:hypothetical protein CDL12_06222 [Handroanthus impetiginosus]|uniref:MULE transposase domain-containing protein n=1 Tax=Handroanthus impetiginosus TaxID=429701 RepID=A0A2G9HUA4_9LAMI|nr:hypothetical protein CDL12_06222 [Handroanthus impetiginosus]